MKKLLLIDANSLIHRSFHALPELTNAEGFPTGALYGLLNMALKILKREKPDYVAAAFDRPEPTFRKELDNSYKAHRPKAPDALVAQIAKAREVLSALGIRSFELPGYEADDIIGTFAKRFKGKAEVRILTGDLDSLQLVEGKRISVVTLRKGVTDIVEYDEKAVEDRFGVQPKRLADWKALVGDPSDNISGVPGIGAVGAAKLLSRFNGVEEILASKDDDALAKKVREHRKEALLSKTLATINTAVGLDPDLRDLAWEGLKTEKMAPLLRELGFESLLKRLGAEEAGKAGERPRDKEGQKALSLFESSRGKNDGEGTVAYFLSDENIAERIKKLGASAIKAGYDWKSLYKASASRGERFEMDGSFFDVCIAGWLLDPDLKDYALRSLYQKEFKRDPTGDLAALKELYPALRERVEREGLLGVMRAFEVPLVPFLAEMELRGIGINRKKLTSLRGKVKKETDKAADAVSRLAGEKFNLNSPKQLGEVLFKKLALATEKKKRTKTGLLSTREVVLEEMKGKHPIVPLIMEYREDSKILGTYVEPLLALERNGRIHTTLIQTGTATGRLSSEKPNLQNIPQDSKWAKPLRDCFEARYPFVFAAFDYSQLELRILAHLSGDPGLARTFREGGDIHTMTARKLFNIREVDHAKRRIAKTLNFGVVYGMGSRAFARAAGVTQKEAERYIREYFSEFPRVREWQESQKNHAKRFGWVANENGRKRLFSSFRSFSEVERAAINMPTQSVGADIMKSAIIAVGNSLKGRADTTVVMTVHDELIVEIRDDILKETAETIRNIMESCYPLSVPLKVDVMSGRTLGSMKPL